MDWVGAQFLGYDPQKIPLLDLAFDRFRWPIAEFEPGNIVLLGDDGRAIAVSASVDPVRHPAGWRTAAANVI
jgi:hypothetical protein